MNNTAIEQSWTGQIDSSGRLLIPAETRSLMKWDQGTEVVLESDGDSLRVITRDQFTQEMQSQFQNP